MRSFRRAVSAAAKWCRHDGRFARIAGTESILSFSRFGTSLRFALRGDVSLDSLCGACSSEAHSACALGVWFALPMTTVKILSAIFKDTAPTDAARVWSDWLARSDGEILSGRRRAYTNSTSTPQDDFAVSDGDRRKPVSAGVILTFTGVVLLRGS